MKLTEPLLGEDPLIGRSAALRAATGELRGEDVSGTETHDSQT